MRLFKDRRMRLRISRPASLSPATWHRSRQLLLYLFSNLSCTIWTPHSGYADATLFCPTEPFTVVPLKTVLQPSLVSVPVEVPVAPAPKPAVPLVGISGVRLVPVSSIFC